VFLDQQHDEVRARQANSPLVLRDFRWCAGVNVMLTGLGAFRGTNDCGPGSFLRFFAINDLLQWLDKERYGLSVDRIPSNAMSTSATFDGFIPSTSDGARSSAKWTMAQASG
jgi:hypothetical protein